MARKLYKDVDILRLLKEIEIHINSGLDVISACRKSGINDKTYYNWHRRFGGMSKSQLSELKALAKEKPTS